MSTESASGRVTGPALETTLLRRWSVVVFGTIAASVGTGIIGLTTTVFTKPMAADLDWPRGVINFAHAIGHVAAGIGLILFGKLVGRYGIRIPTLIFLGAFALSLVLVGLMPNSQTYLFAVYVLYGLGGAGGTAVPWAVAIVSMFDRNRGLALAIVISGSAIGMTVWPHLASWLLANHGWRNGFIGLGILTAVISLTATLLAPLPRRNELNAEQAPSGLGDASQIREILSDTIAWKIIIAIVAITIAIAVAHPNIAPMMADKGLDLTKVAILLSVSGAASWAARLAVGPAMDRIHAPYVAAVVMLCPIIAGPVLLFSGSFEAQMLGAALIGIGLGGEADMISFIVSRYFSKRLYSQAVGIVYASWAWGIALSQVVAGAMFNYFQSYDYAVLLAALVGCIAIPAILSLGHYRENAEGH